jgi:hypothetical protein
MEKKDNTIPTAGAISSKIINFAKTFRDSYIFLPAYPDGDRFQPYPLDRPLPSGEISLLGMVLCRIRNDGQMVCMTRYLQAKHA